MENASKALMIAGGVLLAILTLSIAVFVMNAVTSMEEAQTSRALAKQIDAFNKEYNAYNKRRMYGTDVITVINKAENNNAKGENLVEVEVLDENNQIMIVNKEEFKGHFFECIDVVYDENTGLINFMRFRKIDI